MIWPDTGLAWVQSSPNIPDWQTTFPYLCTGLIDNAGVNGGVGTTKPFFYAGGPDVDADALARRLNDRNLPGVYFRPAAWSPMTGFWNGKELSGVELVIFDPQSFLAVRCAVEILCAVRAVAPRQITVKEPAALDRDWGTNTLRLGLLGGKSPDAILAQWSARLDEFRSLRARYLLY